MKNKEKYNLKELADTFYYNNNGDIVVKYDGKEIFYGDEITIIQNVKALLKWLEQDCSILNEKEKEYLSAVIKPWRDKAECITKYRYSDKKEFISIENEYRYVNFPLFEKGTMYKGMELNRKYSLEELGL